MEKNLPNDQGSLHLWSYSHQIQLWLKRDYRLAVGGGSLNRVWREYGISIGIIIVGAEEWTE